MVGFKSGAVGFVAEVVKPTDIYITDRTDHRKEMVGFKMNVVGFLGLEMVKAVGLKSNRSVLTAIFFKIIACFC